MNTQRDMRLKRFDGERAQKILDAANAIIRTIPRSATEAQCINPWCDQASRLLYGEGICPVCYWEDEGIIPLRGVRLHNATLMAQPLFEEEG